MLSELLQLLTEPGCPACRYVTEVERSFFSWFQIENFNSPQVHAQLRAAMGMCPVHSRRLIEEIGEGHIMTTVMREAIAGALLHVRGEGQTGRCPACETAATGSRRARQLVVEGLLDPAIVRLYCDQGGMCLVHVLQTLPGTEPPTLKILAERLLAGLYESVGPPLLGVLAGSDHDAPRRALWRRHLPELPTRGSTVDRLGERVGIDACPVCLSTGTAENDYLRWFVACSSEGDQTLQSDPGEFCPTHLHDARLAVGSHAANFATDHKRAARIAQLERFLARLSELPARARRGRRSNPDALEHIRGELLPTPYCAACKARDGAEGAEQDLVVTALGLPGVRDRYERGHGLCVRHAMRLPDGQAGRVVRRHLDARLSVMAWEVGEIARKYAWAYRHESGGPEQDAWLRALAQIDGRVFAGAPAPPGEVQVGER